MDEFIQVNMKKYPYVITKSLMKKDTYTIQELIEIISNLDDEIEHKKEEFENYKQFVADNYRQLTYEEQVL